MSRARHSKKEHRASGGATEVGGNPKVFALAKEGTAAVHGEKSKGRMDRARGGACHADGGKAGSDAHPYTSAHKSGGKVGGKGGFNHNARGR